MLRLALPLGIDRRRQYWLCSSRQSFNRTPSESIEWLDSAIFKERNPLPLRPVNRAIGCDYRGRDPNEDNTQPKSQKTSLSIIRKKQPKGACHVLTDTVSIQVVVSKHHLPQKDRLLPANRVSSQQLFPQKGKVQIFLCILNGAWPILYCHFRLFRSHRELVHFTADPLVQPRAIGSLVDGTCKPASST